MLASTRIAQEIPQGTFVPLKESVREDKDIMSSLKLVLLRWMVSYWIMDGSLLTKGIPGDNIALDKEVFDWITVKNGTDRL